MKEGQVYYSNNILLNLETIFKIDNKKLMHEEPDNPPYTSCKVRLVIIGIVVFSI